MQIILDIVFLAIGFLLLAKGADFFVDGASSVARRFKIPQLVIGLTIVAMGTSMPEAAVSIQAALGGNADISIGNVVGSNILNVLIILGISSLIVPINFDPKFLIDTAISLGACVMLLVLTLKERKLYRYGGAILLLSYAGYFTYLLLSM